MLVVIPCYNAADTLSEQLDALSQQHWIEPWEVVVTNNRCTDDSMAIVQRYYGNLPNLRIVDASIAVVINMFRLADFLTGEKVMYNGLKLL